MLYTDCHIHLADTSIQEPCPDDTFFVCSSAYTIPDYEKTEQIAVAYNTGKKTVYLSFGVHPQKTDQSLLDFLSTLLQQDRLDAVGEIGFDFYTEDDVKNEKVQEYFWNEQLALAIEYQKPIIIHCRKALPKLFTYTDKMKKLPAIIFHSWNSSLTEAESLLKKGTNAYFSIGKQVLNNNKKVLIAAENLPADRLLAETDAPYQILKGENESTQLDIIRVYKKIAELRKISEEELVNVLYCNFCKAFSISGIRS